MSGLFIIIGVVVALLLLFTSTGRTIGRTFLNFFVTDALKNPKAANAVYMQAIDEAQEQYGNASDTLNQLQGQKLDFERKLETAKNELKKCEADCERLAAVKSKGGEVDMEALEIKSEKRGMLVTKIETYNRRITELTPLVEEAKTIHKDWQKKIRQLQEQKDLQVSELELTNSMQTLYAKMDNLRRDSATDKMVGKIQDNVASSRQRADGARMTYENQLTTKEARIADRVSKMENDDYIQSLLNKHK